MTLEGLLTQINIAYRGSDDDVPATGTTDYNLWLGTANRKIAEWVNGGKWTSLFDVRSIGTVAASTQSYDLDDAIVLPADRVVVITTDGHKIYYTIVKPQERDRFSKAVYIASHDPQVLTFVDTINSTDQIVGGTINVAGYYRPDDLAKSKDTVPVDNPYWLVYAVAGELAFNDLTYSAKAPDLVAKANNLWDGMVADNRRGTNDNPRTVPTRVNRIRGSRGAVRDW